MKVPTTFIIGLITVADIAFNGFPLTSLILWLGYTAYKVDKA